MADARPASSAPPPQADPFGFERPLPHDGYVWWYFDAISDDGRHALTVIAMLGTVFSPYYAWARRRGPTDPLQHCALNVALYGEGGRRWAMTERGAGAVERAPGRLRIGPSALAWDGDALEIRIDERCAPLPRALRGRLRLSAPHYSREPGLALDADARHEWRPIAPCARIDVEMEAPALRWQGDAYLDSNSGSRPLEADFLGWTWSRAATPDGTRVTYDVVARDGRPRGIALQLDAAGARRPVDVPPAAALARTPWQMPRSTRCDPGQRPTVVATLEDGPFYTRSIIDTRHGGQPLREVHESLLLTRFASPWIQMLLPVRMPRRSG